VTVSTPHRCLADAAAIDDRASSLSGGRALIRRFRSSDVTAFQAYRNDPASAEFQGWDVPYGIDQASEFVAWATTAPLGVPGAWCQLAVESQHRCALVGDVGLHVLADDPTAVEVGVTLAAHARGGGIATEAVGLALDHLRGAYGIDRAIAWITADNIPSRRLFENLGFTLTGTQAAEDRTVECRYLSVMPTRPSLT
jgi:RimJ/RimL family protein N-acetyltransferase